MKHFNAELTDTVVQQRKGTTVQGAADDNLVGRPEQGPKCGSNRTHAGTERHRGFTTFQRRHS